MATIELSKPGYYKRFIDCATTDDDLWICRLGSSVGCTIKRLSSWPEQQITAVHYKLPQDMARCMFEVQLYYTSPSGSHFFGELDGRVGDAHRASQPDLAVLAQPRKK